MITVVTRNAISQPTHVLYSNSANATANTRTGCKDQQNLDNTSRLTHSKPGFPDLGLLELSTQGLGFGKMRKLHDLEAPATSYAKF